MSHEIYIKVYNIYLMIKKKIPLLTQNHYRVKKHMLLSNYIITRAKFPMLSNLVLKFEKKIKITGEEKEKFKWIKKRGERKSFVIARYCRFYKFVILGGA